MKIRSKRRRGGRSALVRMRVMAAVQTQTPKGSNERLFEPFGVWILFQNASSHSVSDFFPFCDCIDSMKKNENLSRMSECLGNSATVSLQQMSIHSSWELRSCQVLHFALSVQSVSPGHKETTPPCRTRSRVFEPCVSRTTMTHQRT